MGAIRSGGFSGGCRGGACVVSHEAAQKRIVLAVDHLKEAGIDDCLIVFEGADDRGRVRPFALVIGSPSASLEFARYAVERLEGERDIAVYGAVEDEGDCED